MMSSSLRVRRGAFTLLELIVVVVVLGVLAAIAVPTFRAVIERSEDAAAEAELRSMAREVQALEAFSPGNGWSVGDVESLAADMSALSVGVSAAEGWGVVELPTVPAAEELGYLIDGEGLLLAVSSDERVYVLGVSASELGVVRSASVSAAAGLLGEVSADLEGLSSVLPAGVETSQGVTGGPGPGSGPGPVDPPALSPVSGYGWMKEYDGFHYTGTDHYWGVVRLAPGTVVEVGNYVAKSGQYAGLVHDVEVILEEVSGDSSGYCYLVSPRAVELDWSYCADAPGEGQVATGPSTAVIPEDGIWVAHIVDYGPMSAGSPASGDEYAWCLADDYVCAVNFEPVLEHPEVVLFDRQASPYLEY